PVTTTFLSPTTLVFRPESGHAFGPVDVVVTNPDGQSSTRANGFTYLEATPIGVTISPASGPTLGGTPVRITGTGFLGGASVSIGGVPATNVTVLDSLTIVATTGAHSAGAFDVEVRNPASAGAVLPGRFSY